ncbi:MAG TPA: GTPase [Planctomycetota bacterium]|nr:GTPase [Planctomycetota bacterium]
MVPPGDASPGGDAGARLRLRELSAPGVGALSIMELTGEGAQARLEALSGGRSLVGGGPHLVTLKRGADTLDEALVVIHDPGHLELHLHGSPAVVEAVARELGGIQPEPAPTSLEEAALADLRQASCEAAARILLDQADGALGRALAELEGKSRKRQLAGLRQLLAAGRRAARVLRPVTVVLAGPVNAGKSTLFNTLLGEDRALVHRQGGTTRDALGEAALFGEWPVQLVDTAGLRELAGPGGGADGDGGAQAEAEVEAVGQERARSLAERAELVFWCAPAPAPAAGAGAGAGEPLREGVPAAALRRITTRAGRVAPGSVAAREQPQATRDEVARLFREHFDLPLKAWEPRTPVPFRREQLEVLERTIRGTTDGGEAPPVGPALLRLLQPIPGPQLR